MPSQNCISVNKLVAWETRNGGGVSGSPPVRTTNSCFGYRIRSIRRRGYYLFHHAILCGFYLRAAFIKLSGIGKIFCKCKGFEKRFYKINKELRCGDLVLKQNFQLLDQPSLSYKAVRRDTATLATATDTELEESDPFADVEEDEDELEENELVLEDC